MMLLKENLGYFGDDPQHDFDELGSLVVKIQVSITLSLVQTVTLVI